MSEAVLMWILGGSFFCIGGVYAVTLRKVDKQEFKEHCTRQEKVNDKFEDIIYKNNELLARVDERLKKDE